MGLKGRKMFPVGLGLGLLLAGIGAAAFWLQRHPDPSSVFNTSARNQAEGPAQLATSEDLATLKAEMERLKGDKNTVERLAGEMRSELTALRSRLTQVDQAQNSINREISQLTNEIVQASRAGAEVPAGDEDTPNLTPAEEHERIETQTRAQIELIEASILAENTDPEWASTAQLALGGLFQREEMAGLHLVDADCRTTLCRLELFLDDSVSLEDSFRNLAHFTPWQGQGFVEIDQGGSGGIVMYLSREGHSLPQLTE